MARRHTSVDLPTEQRWQNVSALKRQHSLMAVPDPQVVQFVSSPQAKKKRVTTPQTPLNIQNGKLDPTNPICHLINFPQPDPKPQSSRHQPQERHMVPISNVQRPHNPHSVPSKSPGNPVQTQIIRALRTPTITTRPPNVGISVPVRYIANPRGAVISERAPPTISTFSTQQVRPHSGSLVIPVSLNPVLRPDLTKLNQPNPVLTSRAAYTRIPLDVNNNNITTLVPRHPLNPQMQGPPKPIHNPPATSSVIRPMQTNQINPAIPRPPLGGIPTEQFIQEQQKLVDEKIRQLEAIKRELTIQGKIAVQGHPPVATANQQTAVNTVYQPQVIRRPPPSYHPSTNQGPAMPRPRLNQPIRIPQQPVNQILHQPRIIQNQAPPPPSALAHTPNVPVYRNGGLSITRKETPTLKTSQAEPILIDDDIIAKKQSLIARNRHSYSFHPPLSKNKDSQRVRPLTPAQHQMRMPVPQQRLAKPHVVTHPAPHQQRMIQTVQAPPQTSSPAEICIVCGCKSFFLCSGCKKTWYCSTECQFKDWTKHSAHCSG